MDAAEKEKHDKSYARAFALLRGEISLDGAPPLEKPHFFVRRRLETAIGLLEDVLRLNPENWSAMFGAGKAHQRLGNSLAAFELLSRAHVSDPSTAEYAREAGLLATELGLTLEDG
jgi:tetratricopeptide (TPR) repeat protein